MRFDQPPPEPLASAAGFLLSWHGRRTATGFAETMAGLGLNPPQFGVMQMLDAEPGRAQRELVEGAMIDASAMVAVIDSLEGEGLLERRANPDDRRKNALYLTAKGKRTLERARKAADEFAEEILGPLDTSERETLTILLRKLAGLG